MPCVPPVTIAVRGAVIPRLGTPWRMTVGESLSRTGDISAGIFSPFDPTTSTSRSRIAGSASLTACTTELTRETMSLNRSSSMISSRPMARAMRWKNVSGPAWM